MKTFVLALLDLVGGPLLDKTLLTLGVRVGSMRRIVVAAMAIRVFIPPELTWVDVTAMALILIALDLQGAIRAAPEMALSALGSVVGKAAGVARSAYQSSSGVFNKRAPDTDTPEAS